MKKNTDNQLENEETDPIMRRGFLKTAALLGLGTVASGPFTSRANSTKRYENKKGIGTIITKKRSLGSKKNPLVV